MAAAACLLDSIRVADLPTVARLFSEPKVRSFLGGPVDPQIAQQRAAELAQQARAWAVRPNPGNSSLLGIVVLDQHHDLQDLEVSYLFLPEHWGRGYATETVHQVLAHAFGIMRLRRVVAETQSANAPSVRLLERLGFRLLRSVSRFGAEQSIYLAEPPFFHAAT
ncbi:GNAT family N-acetyltransferase [Paucibacter sp. XJ19-41]|uniref:GNAT family N-acetyltransferase n=1 Tax=Paucibacter sp. XJ19-41 TaxID=2927824 RepID=UPI0023493600|nr:GNAT family N-acetyltransferase [Paucibacter sp. XJ19-41]MDC6171170.1 GNAT family N-acetyltransferase [Paucibacter sp. XJ19-41]